MLDRAIAIVITRCNIYIYEERGKEPWSLIFQKKIVAQKKMLDSFYSFLTIFRLSMSSLPRMRTMNRPVP